MFDLFGTGARARVKALEEALAREVETNRLLRLDLVALADVKAHRSIITPARAPSTETVVPAPLRGLVRPGEHRNVNATLSAVRAAARLKES